MSCKFCNLSVMKDYASSLYFLFLSAHFFCASKVAPLVACYKKGMIKTRMGSVCVFMFMC